MIATPAMTGLTHFNEAGEAHMVDVGAKEATRRRAIAEGWIRLLPATLELILTGVTRRGTYWASPASPASWGPNAPRIWCPSVTPWP
jgi:hypothetical protein